MSLEGTRYDGGTPAALTFYLKNLLYSDDTTALGAGLGVGVPCSSDVVLSLPTDTLRYREETLHLMPYIGFMSMPTDNWFFNGFLQLDFSTGENQLDSMAFGPTDPVAGEPARTAHVVRRLIAGPLAVPRRRGAVPVRAGRHGRTPLSHHAR